MPLDSRPAKRGRAAGRDRPVAADPDDAASRDARFGLQMQNRIPRTRAPNAVVAVTTDQRCWILCAIPAPRRQILIRVVRPRHVLLLRLWNTPGECDGLHWPRCDGLKWPHLGWLFRGAAPRRGSASTAAIARQAVASDATGPNKLSSSRKTRRSQSASPPSAHITATSRNARPGQCRDTRLKPTPRMASPSASVSPTRSATPTSSAVQGTTRQTVLIGNHTHTSDKRSSAHPQGAPPE